MSSSKTSVKSLNLDNFIPSVFIIAFLLVGFIPNLGAVDKIAPQWVYLSGINILSAIYLFKQKKQFSESIIKTLNTCISIFYILFFLWALGSYFYAINPTETLVNLTRQSNTLLYYDTSRES